MKLKAHRLKHKQELAKQYLINTESFNYLYSLQQNLKKLHQLALIPINLVMTNNENLSLFNIVRNSLPLSVPKRNCLIR